MNRAQRRALKKKKGLATAEEDQFLFHLMPDSCSSCGIPFDKKDKQQALTWSVVVRKADKRVSLFCPSCIQKKREVTDGFGIRASEGGSESDG
jgi:hypothetical protein